MVDEMGLSLEQQRLGEERANIVAKNLRRRHINVQYFASRKEALDAILKMIPPGAKVARGDSLSVDQIGVIPELIRLRQNTIIDPYRRDTDGYYIDSAEARRQMQREAFLTDVFLSGTNAVTLDGKLVNVDMLGNRVAAMLFGPKKVILVAGVNKIVNDVNEAMERIRQVAAPGNAQRHYLKHHYEEFANLPCVKTGRCVNCSHDFRICSFTVIIESTALRDQGRINLMLVGEELGI